MLSIGGNQEVNISTFQDPWIKGLGIFDMTTLNWTNAYDAAATAYEQPSLVSQFYANNSRYPIAWDDPELKSIFTTLKQPNGTANVSSGSGGSNGITSGIVSNEITGINAVVGGVIGGVSALAIIASLIYCRLCLYKRKEKQSLDIAELVANECIAGEIPRLRGPLY
jgi:hypothetical protein